MPDISIECPHCRKSFHLNETLAAPIIEQTRRDFEREFGEKEKALEERRKTFAADQEAVKKTRAELENQRAALAKEKEGVDAAVAEKLKAERVKIAADEAKKAKLALGDELEQKAKELTELNAILKQRDEKLAEAQKAQAELVRKERELADAKREMELTIETRVTQSLGKMREQAKKEAEEQLSLKLIEKQTTIESMQRQIEELKKKAEQGSQQLQGEALELQLQSILTGKFPHDTIMPVPKGEHGGDIVQRVMLPTGTACGTILWESKRTKNWSNGWLPKLREDQRQAKAEIAVIVSAILPDGVETFDQIDGVWVVHPRALLPVAMSLRHTLIEVNCARQAGEGRQTKMEMIYHYLTGPKFRLRVQAIIEAFSTLSDDLVKEKKAILKQWAKREEQINRAMEATAGMYGELQGIAGKSLQEIDGLDIAELPADEPALLQ